MEFLSPDSLLHSLRAALNRQEMMKSTLAATASFFIPLFTNFPLISALTAFLVGQFIKLFILRYKESRWDFKKLIASGGMPSSHSATVTALAAAIALQEGFRGPPFATALVSAFVVMYDATGMRLQAGQQAEVPNQTVSQLPTEQPLAESRPPHEHLGHTLCEVVAGGLLGIFTAAIIDSTTGLPVYQYCRGTVYQNFCILPSHTYSS